MVEHSCNLCGKSYSTLYSLRRHIGTVCTRPKNANADRIIREIKIAKNNDPETYELILARLIKDGLITQKVINSVDNNYQTKIVGNNNSIACRDIINNNSFHIDNSVHIDLTVRFILIGTQKMIQPGRNILQ